MPTRTTGSSHVVPRPSQFWKNIIISYYDRATSESIMFGKLFVIVERRLFLCKSRGKNWYRRSNERSSSHLPTNACVRFPTVSSTCDDRERAECGSKCNVKATQLKNLSRRSVLQQIKSQKLLPIGDRLHR